MGIPPQELQSINRQKITRRDVLRVAGISAGLIAIGTGVKAAYNFIESLPSPFAGYEKIAALESEIGDKPLTFGQAKAYIGASAQFFAESFPLAIHPEEFAKKMYVAQAPIPLNEGDIYYERVRKNDPTLKDDPAIQQIKKDYPDFKITDDFYRNYLLHLTAPAAWLVSDNFQGNKSFWFFLSHINQDKSTYQLLKTGSPDQTKSTPATRIRTAVFTALMIDIAFPSLPIDESSLVKDSFFEIFHDFAIFQNPSVNTQGLELIIQKQLFRVAGGYFDAQGIQIYSIEETFLDNFVREYLCYAATTKVGLSYAVPLFPNSFSVRDLKNFDLVWKKTGKSTSDLFSLYKQGKLKEFLIFVAEAGFPTLQSERVKLFRAYALFAHTFNSDDPNADLSKIIQWDSLISTGAVEGIKLTNQYELQNEFIDNANANR